MADLKNMISWLWPQVLFVSKGKETPVLEVAIENGKKVLNAGTVNYSFGSLHDVFRLALQKAKVETLRPDKILILGFGVGSVATILLEEMKLQPSVFTGIEADEVVIRIGKEEFDTERFKNLRLVHERAERFVAADPGSYDLIAVDLFVEDQVPEACQSEEFLQNLSRLLSPEGLLVFNTMPVENLSGESVFFKRFMSVFPNGRMQEIRTGEAKNFVFITKK